MYSSSSLRGGPARDGRGEARERYTSNDGDGTLTQEDRAAGAPTAGARWVTVFNGSREAYRVPAALYEAGLLQAHVADWYTPLDRPGAAALASRLPARARATLAKRYTTRLPSARVRSAWYEYAVQTLRPSAMGAVDARLGARAGRLARATGAGVFSYSYYAAAAFRAYGDGPRARVLYQVHPHPAVLRDLFREEMARVPAAASLATESELVTDAARFDALCEEPHLADVIVVSSGYTARTLAERGVDPARFRMVRYGVALPAEWPARAPGPYRVLFVGQMVQRKGLSYLLDAWARLGLRNAELVLAGRGRKDDALLARLPAGVRVEENVSRARLDALYASSDLFCMPSIAEGFGLVYLEAMARGVPVVGTVNTGAPDVVTPGVDGWVIPIRDVDAVAERIAWGHANRDALAAMRPAARRTAERYTWDAFGAGIVRVAREASTIAPAR